MNARRLLEQAQQNEVAEAKLRTARKGGGLLADTPLFGRKDVSRDATRLPAGVSRSQSSRWQAIAAVPVELFEQFIAEAKASEEEVEA